MAFVVQSIRQTAKTPRRGTGGRWPSVSRPARFVLENATCKKPSRHQPNSTLHRNHTPPPIHSSSILPLLDDGPPLSLGPSAPPRTQKNAIPAPSRLFPRFWLAAKNSPVESFPMTSQQSSWVLCLETSSMVYSLGAMVAAAWLVAGFSWATRRLVWFLACWKARTCV